MKISMPSSLRASAGDPSTPAPATAAPSYYYCYYRAAGRLGQVP
jgi:hypothetical protein